MPSLISHLNRSERRELLDDLNYLNTGELRTFCREHSIPYKIYIETASGERKRTKDTDRKSVVLGRIRHYLESGRVPAETCFPAAAVRLDSPPAEFGAEDHLYYGWYDKHNPSMVGLLERLTGGKFRNGAVARILAREFWTAGTAPTFREFAEAWVESDAKGLGVDRGEHPEAAWLTDRARGDAGRDWKAKRERIAQRAITVLDAIPKPT